MRTLRRGDAQIPGVWMVSGRGRVTVGGNGRDMRRGPWRGRRGRRCDDLAAAAAAKWRHTSNSRSRQGEAAVSAVGTVVARVSAAAVAAAVAAAEAAVGLLP